MCALHYTHLDAVTGLEYGVGVGIDSKVNVNINSDYTFENDEDVGVGVGSENDHQLDYAATPGSPTSNPSNSDPIHVDIEDARFAKIFTTISFSGYKKTAVFRALVESLIQSKTEESCYWAADLVCAGHLTLAWDAIVFVFFKYIHTSNVKVIIYIHEQMGLYQSIIQAELGMGMVSSATLSMRNNMSIRTIFAQCICVIAESRRGRIFKEIKVDIRRLQLITLCETPETAAKYFLAPSIEYGQPVFLEGDPIELSVALNELAFAVSKTGANLSQGCFWVEWILLYIKTRNKQNKSSAPLTAARRAWATRTPSMQTNPIWTAWAVCLEEGARRGGLYERIIQSCHFVYAFELKRSDIAKRRGLLYFAINILTDVVDCGCAIIKCRAKLAEVDHITALVYAKLKKKEVRYCAKGPWA